MITDKPYLRALKPAFQMTAKDLRHTAFGYLGKNEGQQVNKECRICLSGEDQYHKLVKFCKCAGTIEHVHEECLKEWIMTKINIKTDIVRCELCQEEFKYTTKTHKTFTCQRILQLAKHQPLLTFLKLLVYLVFLVGNVFFTCLLAKATSEPDDGNLRRKLLFSEKMEALYIVIVFFIYLALIFVAILYIDNCCIKQVIEVQILSSQQETGIEQSLVFPVRWNHRKIRINPLRLR